MPTVAYQGHPGAFSDVAARELIPGAQTRGYGSFDAVAEAVAGGEVEYGVLPVENAIAGPVPRNYELLWEHPSLRIHGETMLAIERTGNPSSRPTIIAPRLAKPTSKRPAPTTWTATTEPFPSWISTSAVSVLIVRPVISMRIGTRVPGAGQGR